MTGGGLHAVELVFLLLLLFVVVFAWVAKKLGTPYPIVLVIAGLLLSFVPGIPRISLNPDLVFLVVLPPLLYSAAWLTSWRDFKYNMVSILMLAFGLVGFTVLGISATTRWILPGLDWKLGFVLGAIVSTTDAIAATSIAKRLGLPQGIVDVLEGESLVNDATGLLALEFGLAMVVTQRTPSATEGVFRLAYLIFVGLGIGLLIGLVVDRLERRVDDAPIEIAMSILVPYATYLAADAARASGVLAVVACGLYLSRRSSDFFSPTVRIQAWAVWESFTFVLNGLVFVLIGLQLPFVRSEIRGYSHAQLIRFAALFSGIVILLRLLWMFPGARVSYFVRRKFLRQGNRKPPARQIFVVGWAGMRGVVSLAAALSLPTALKTGAPFPARNLIIFLTFSVILVTLVLQGLTLPPLIRILGLAGSGAKRDEEDAARLAMVEAALTHLATVRTQDDDVWAELYDEFEQKYRRKLLAVSNTEDGEGRQSAERLARQRKIWRDVLHVERSTLIQLRNHGRINDEVLRHLERELDLRETELAVHEADSR